MIDLAAEKALLEQKIARLQARPKSMRRVYIAHALSSDTHNGIEANRARAGRWVAWAARQGVSPSATWIVLTGQWQETPENRALGLACDKAEIEGCDELWLCGELYSAGMQIEAEYAREHGVRVKSLLAKTVDGEPPL